MDSILGGNNGTENNGSLGLDSDFNDPPAPSNSEEPLCSTDPSPSINWIDPENLYSNHQAVQVLECLSCVLEKSCQALLTTNSPDSPHDSQILLKEALSLADHVAKLSPEKDYLAQRAAFCSFFWRGWKFAVRETPKFLPFLTMALNPFIPKVLHLKVFVSTY